MDRTIKKRGNLLHQTQMKKGKDRVVNNQDLTGAKINNGIMHWLGIPLTTAKTMHSDFDIIKLGAVGITKSSINNLASHIGMSRKNMAEDIFDVSVKTLERKDSKTRLDKKTTKILFVKKRENLLVVPRKTQLKKSKAYGVNRRNSTGSKINTGITHWLGIPLATAKTMHSDFDIVKLGAAGITKSAINTLASHIGISRKNMAEDIFDVSVKTLERKDSKTRLDKKITSHALEIAKVVQHAYEVFRDEEKVKLWVNRENKALNNMKPVKMFDTLSVLNMVNDILGRIEVGVYS
jgi:putative toxin-antitoxin system antitoxin component (TIGR02293 family)